MNNTGYPPPGQGQMLGQAPPQPKIDTSSKYKSIIYSLTILKINMKLNKVQLVLTPSYEWLTILSKAISVCFYVYNLVLKSFIFIPFCMQNFRICILTLLDEKLC